MPNKNNVADLELKNKDRQFGFIRYLVTTMLNKFIYWFNIAIKRLHSGLGGLHHESCFSQNETIKSALLCFSATANSSLCWVGGYKHEDI